MNTSGRQIEQHTAMSLSRVPSAFFSEDHGLFKEIVFVSLPSKEDLRISDGSLGNAMFPKVEVSPPDSLMRS
jgi:hypothetical protein